MMWRAARTGSMLPFRFLLAATLASTTIALSATPKVVPDSFACPDASWTYFSYKCYKRTSATYTWQAARDQCTQAGGDLAVVEQIAELGYFKQAWSPVYDVHVGLYKDSYSGQTMWVDGAMQTVHLTLFDSTPLVASNMCYFVQLTTGFYYYDGQCSSLRYGVCQVEAIPTSLAAPFEESSVRGGGVSAAVYNLTTGSSRQQCIAACNMMNASYGAVVDTACMCFTDLTSVTTCPNSICATSPINMFPTHSFLSYAINATSQIPTCTLGSYFEGSCYWLTSTTNTWNAQRSSCQGSGGDLVTVHSLEEYSFITDVVMREWNGYYRTDTPWIGLQYTGSALTWTDNTVVSSSFEAIASPQSYTSTGCIYIGNYVWMTDSDCNTPRSAICKSPAAVTSSPTYAYTSSATGQSYVLFSALENWFTYTGGGYYTQNSFVYSSSNLAYGLQPQGRSTPKGSSVQPLLRPGLIELDIYSYSFMMRDSSNGFMRAQVTMGLLDVTLSCPQYALQTFSMQCTVGVLSGSAIVTVSFADLIPIVTAATTVATTTTVKTTTAAATTTPANITSTVYCNSASSTSSANGTAAVACTTAAAASTTTPATTQPPTTTPTTPAPTTTAAPTSSASTRRTSFTLAGSSVYAVGSQFASPSAWSMSLVPSTVFLAAAGFDYHGKIYALEMDVMTEGAITFVVWRPSCTAGTLYCHKAAACIANTTNCSTQATYKKFSCPSSTLISSGTRLCVNPTTGQTQRAYPVELPVQTYTVVSQMAYTIPRRGYQILQLTNGQAMEVLPGDYLGYYSSVAALNFHDYGITATTVNNNRTSYTFLYVQSSGATTFTQKSSVTAAAGVIVGTQDIFLRAHVARYVQVKVIQTYNGVGVFPVNVSVSSQLSKLSQNVSTVIQVDTMIQNVSVSPKYQGVAMYYNTTFAVDPHPGTSVMYHWDFNDTTTLDTANRTFVQHVFYIGGVLNVTVTASNALSQASSWIILFIQQEILNASVNALQNVTLLHNLTYFQASITAGTNVSWLFDTKDNAISYFINLTNNAQVIQLSHNYSAWGNYTMNITMWNQVSVKVLSLTHIVEEEITGLQILQPPHIGYGRNVTINMTMANGTDVTYTSTLDGNKTRDMQMDWRTRTGSVQLVLADYVRTGPHLLNITGSNLLGWQTDGIQFWIDYIITNVSIEANTTYLRSFTDPCLFTVTMNNGSRLQLNISYGDGSVNYHYWDNDFLANDVSQFIYTYPFAGHYMVVLVATNAINQMTVSKNVTVQNPVFGLNITTNTPQALYPGSVATVQFFLGFLSLNGDGPPFRIPSEAFQLYTYGDYDCLGVTAAAPTATQNATATTARITSGNSSVSNITTTTTEATTATTSSSSAATSPTVVSLSLSQLNSSINGTSPSQMTAASVALTTVYVPLLRPTLAAPNFAGCTDATKYATVNVSEQWLDISSWNYNRFGTYTVTLNVSNFVSYMFWNFTIDVDEPVLNLIIIADHYIIEWNTTVNLTSSMTWGSRINLTWDFADGSDTVLTPYNPLGINEVTHLCNVVGVFHSDVTATNLVSSVTAWLESPLIVQHKVQHFLILGPKISLIKKMKFEVIVHFLLVVEKPYHIATNASYNITFGDGTPTNSSYLEGARIPDLDTDIYSHALSFEHGYLFGGDYEVCITLWNLVNNGTYCFNHTVYDTIYGTRDKVYYIGDNLTNFQGYLGDTDQPNYFRLEDEIEIFVNSTRGSHIYYHWDFGDNTNETYYMIKSVKHKYAQPGLYNVTVNASNLLTWDLYAGIVIVQRTIANISISGDSPFPRNETASFQVDFGTIGTDACYTVNFLDEQSVDSQYLFFGNRTTCEEYYSSEMQVGTLRFEPPYSVRDFETIRDQTNITNVTMSNEFMAIGVYYITFEAVNRVSQASATWRIGVTRGPCRWPVINLKDVNGCNDPKYCINGTKAVIKSSRLYVESYVFLNCSSSAVALYEWTVERSVDNKPDGAFELYNDTGITLSSPTLRSLSIPPLTLPYGLYRFTLNVSMEGEIEIFTTDSVNIYIVQSPLVTGIVGGIMIRKQWGKNYTFDAASQCYDPDNPTNKTGFSFKWFCRRLCQDFPTYDPTYTHIISPPVRNNCTVVTAGLIPVMSTDGCFKDDGFDSPGVFTNSTSGNVTVNLANAQERDEIEVMVVVTFVGKVFVINQYMDVTLGDPPSLFQNCITNCKDKLNALSRLSLETTAEGSFGISMVWNWRMYRGPAGSLSIIGIKNVSEPWQNFASTGTANPSIALEPGFFDTLGNATSYRYFLQVTAYRVTSGPDNYGTSFYSFELNQPPDPGNCSVVPSNGTALDTAFNIACTSLFNTTYLPLLYEIAYRLDSQSNYMWISSGFKPQMESARVLPAGLHDNDYVLQVVVRGTDSIGGVRDLLLNVTVYPAPEDNLQTLLDQLLAPDGEVSPLQNTVSSGDAGAVASIFGAIGTTMNIMSIEYDDTLASQIAGLNASAGNLTANINKLNAARNAIKQLYIKARETMIHDMSKLAIKDVSALRQLASSISNILSREDEVSPDATIYSRNLINNSLTMILQQDRETKMPAEQMESAVEACLCAIGALMDATAYLKSTSAVGEDADSLQIVILNSLLTLSSNIQSKKVAKEYATYISSEKMALTASKNYPEDFSNVAIKTPGGQIQMPNASNILGENSTATYLQTQITMMVNNPFTSQSNGTDNSSMPVTSRVLRLTITDNTGCTPNITTDKAGMHMYIHHDITGTVLQTTYMQPSLPGSPLVIRKVSVNKMSSAFFSVKNFINGSNSYASSTTPGSDVSGFANSTTDSNGTTTQNYKFTVYIGVNQKPTYSKYDLLCKLPIVVGEVNGTIMVTEGGVETPSCPAPNCGVKYLQDASLYPATGVAGIDPNTCLVPEMLTNKTEDFTLYVGVTYTVDTVTVGGNASSTTVAPPTGRRRRAADSAIASNNTGNSSSNSSDAGFIDPRVLCSMQVYAAQCNYWNPYLNKWSNEGCKVGPISSLGVTHCICDYLSPPIPASNETNSISTSMTTSSASMTTKTASVTTSAAQATTRGSSDAPGIAFGAGLILPMNTINLSDSAFNHLNENPLVFSVLVTIFCLYFCALIWARRKDLDDAIKAGASPLLDNNPYDMYLYELTVYTGGRSRAGTTAKVSMILAGDKDETPPRLIYDDKRPVLQRGGVDSFVMAVPSSLGSLSHIRVWHDNGGKSPSWFFSRLQVIDMQTFNKYYFILDRWLAVDEEDGIIDRLVPLAGKDEMTGFNHLFWTKTKKDMFDGHLWFSIVGRPHKSRFTRCQRLTCCLSLIFSCMLTNIMFYKTASASAPTDGFSIGPVTITFQAIMKGVVSSLISLPVNLAIALIFKKARSKPMKTNIKAQLGSTNAHNETGEVETEQNRIYSDERLDRSNKSLTNLAANDVANKGSKGKPEKAKKNKGKLKFPWWTIFIAYFLALVTCGVSFWAIVEFAGVFGPEKAQQWLCSFMFSVVESIFVSQPIKVVLLALFFALVIKKPANDEDADNSLDKGEEYLHKHVTAEEAKSHDVREALSKYKNIPLPPCDDYIKAAKEKRVKENKMMEVLREIAFYLIFLYLMSMAAYGNVSPWDIMEYSNLRAMFEDGLYNQTEWDAADMAHVKIADSFFEWTDRTLLPALYGDPDWPGFAVDRSFYLAVPPRLRQLRISSAKCQMPVYKYVRVCDAAYDPLQQDTASYKKRWILANASAGETGDVGWLWQSADTLGGQDYIGQVAWYGGGGYAVDLGNSLQAAQDTLDSLKESSWLDAGTRAVFVEFVLYNPNMNEFAVSHVAFEFIPSGSVLPLFQMHLMGLDSYFTTFELVLLGFQVLALLFIFFFMFRELKIVIKQKLKYFYGFWNIFEFIILGLALAAVAIFFCRLAAQTKTRSKFLANRGSFVSFYDASTWDKTYCLLLGIIVFCAFIKLLKVMRFNKRISMIGLTLKYMMKPLGSFMLGLFIIFFAYVQMSYIVFGTQLFEFSSLTSSVLHMVTMMLNKISYSALQTANPIFAPIIFFTFVIGVNFMLLSFMVTIIMEGFSATVEELKEKKNKYEIVDFIVNRFKSLVGYSSTNGLPPMRENSKLVAEGVHEELDERIKEFEERFFGYCDIECKGFKADVDLLERDLAKKKDTLVSKTVFSA